MSVQDRIDVLDERGQVLETKQRPIIDRKRDILPTVYVFVQPVPGHLLIATIPDDAYGSRGDYVGKLGFPVASFVRHGEEPVAAATRAVKKDLNVDAADLTLLKQGYIEFSDGLRRHAWVYELIHPGPFTADSHAASNLESMPLTALRSEVSKRPHRFAPSLLMFLPLL